MTFNATTYILLTDLVAFRSQLLPSDWQDIGAAGPKGMIEIVVKYMEQFQEWNPQGKREGDSLRKKSPFYPDVIFEELDAKVSNHQCPVSTRPSAAQIALETRWTPQRRLWPALAVLKDAYPEHALQNIERWHTRQHPMSD